jgi:sugar phosphate permease
MHAAGPGRIPPAARVLPSRIFYGWYIAAACACLMFVGVGVGYYGLAVYLRPLQDAHGWSNSAVSGATGLYFSVSGITGAIVGPQIDRRGPVGFMIAGVIITGVAASAIGYVDTLWQLYAVYFVLAIAFGMSTAVATNAIMTRWFVRKRAKAMSISATGVSLGGVILSPLASKLIDVGGLELATPVLGLMVVAVAIPVLALVVSWDPRQMGLKPDGSLPPPAASVRHQLSDAVQMRRWETAEAMRTISFWALLIGFLLVLTAQTGFVIHQVSFLEERMGSRNAAAFTLSVTAAGSIFARLLVGLFADAIDKRLLTVALFVIQATCVVGLVATDNIAATWALVLVFGFTIGNIYMMQSLLVGEIFGIVSFGAVFGLVALAGQVGSGIGLWCVGLLEDATGSYTVPFLMTAGLTYLAAVVISFARPISAAVPHGPPEHAGARVPAGGD